MQLIAGEEESLPVIMKISHFKILATVVPMELFAASHHFRLSGQGNYARLWHIYLALLKILSEMESMALRRYKSSENLL